MVSRVWCQVAKKRTDGNRVGSISDILWRTHASVARAGSGFKKSGGAEAAGIDRSVQAGSSGGESTCSSRCDHRAGWTFRGEELLHFGGGQRAIVNTDVVDLSTPMSLLLRIGMGCKSNYQIRGVHDG